jgi:AraC family transcriptional regulator
MKKIFTELDHKQEDSLRIILPSEPVTSINSANWKNIKFGYHESYGFDIPEHTSKQHGFLIIHKFDKQAQRRLGDEVRDEFIKSGDVIFCPAGVPHSVKWEGEAHYSMIFMEPKYFENFAFESINPCKIEMLEHFAQSDPIVYAIGQMLKSQEQHTVSQLYLDHVALFLAAHVLEKKCTIEHQFLENSDSFSYQQIRQITNYIELRFDKDLCIQELSELMRMSQDYFSKLFKNSFGVPPCQYVIKKRLDKAQYLLKRTSLGVGEVAIMAGFNSHSHFTSTFKQHLLVSPHQYRQML